MELPKTPQRTTPGFVFPTVERALKECFVARQFGQKEIVEILDFFKPTPHECVFCGNLDVERWDHLVPISKGGDTVLGNMVLACSQCDDSKQGKSFEEWMNGSAPLSPKSRGIEDIDKRIERIHTYVRHFGYSPRSLEDRLDERELERLRIIRSKLCEVRDDIETLINDYRARTT